MGAPAVKVYASKTSDYHDAFKVFLDHTDQKTKAREFLDRLVSGLPEQRVFLDAGAGNGKVTAWFTGSFEKTLAIEPSDSLRAELKETCPDAHVVGGSILDAKVDAPGDLVLCSHVLYYIDGALWMKNVEQLASWLSPEGALVVIIQNHASDCMKMLQNFFGHHYNLSKFADEFERKNGSKYQVKIDLVPSQVTAKDFDSAYAIAEFMLNLVPIQNAPLRAELETYVRGNFKNNGGCHSAQNDRAQYRFSCDQSFLQIRRK